MRVRLLKPFGIHEKGDVINVRPSVAEFWLEARMVEIVPTTPEIRSATATPKAETATVDLSPKDQQ